MTRQSILLMSIIQDVLDFKSDATCNGARWTVNGDLNIDDRRTLNVSFDFIDINGNLNLLGECNISKL